MFPVQTVQLWALCVLYITATPQGDAQLSPSKPEGWKAHLSLWVLN